MKNIITDYLEEGQEFTLDFYGSPLTLRVAKIATVNEKPVAAFLRYDVDDLIISTAFSKSSRGWVWETGWSVIFKGKTMKVLIDTEEKLKT